ncbi:hypothetical protein OB2597_20041 [Pseudooceanicola batsensis HTCC2597]|uniref:HPt domain-containing protein n=1 Tax=Pseudooceanicola batsensis (strain ATCC BAA-863 / DSM 15984 / KCTC 12145 / HTCC2597) TaxID=252305 RepID=A3U0W8_PSEBH|nr:hypothetical protein OB2597_20041 [Pseudooceanicola batsensis HTCC2597]
MIALAERERLFEQRVQKTRARFVANLPERLEAIREAARSSEATDGRETQLRKVHRLLHDMAGSAAMLELAEIETSVRRALEIAEEADVRNSPFNREELFLIEAALFDIQATADRTHTKNRTDTA